MWYLWLSTPFVIYILTRYFLNNFHSQHKNDSLMKIWAALIYKHKDTYFKICLIIYPLSNTLIVVGLPLRVYGIFSYRFLARFTVPNMSSSCKIGLHPIIINLVIPIKFIPILHLEVYLARVVNTVVCWIQSSVGLLISTQCGAWIST